MAHPDQAVENRIPLSGGLALRNVAANVVHAVGWHEGSIVNEGRIVLNRTENVSPFTGTLAQSDGGCLYFRDNREDYAASAVHGGLAKLRAARTTKQPCRRPCGSSPGVRVDEPCSSYRLASTLTATVELTALPASQRCLCVNGATGTLTFNANSNTWAGSIALSNCSPNAVLNLEFGCFRDSFGAYAFRLNVYGCEGGPASWRAPMTSADVVPLATYPQTAYPLDLGFLIRNSNQLADTSVRYPRCCPTADDFIIRITDTSCQQFFYEIFETGAVPSSLTTVKPSIPGSPSLQWVRTAADYTSEDAVTVTHRGMEIRNFANTPLSSAVGDWALKLQKSPTISLATVTSATLKFRHRLRRTGAGPVGAVLEASINAGVTWLDITDPGIGGAFVADGYDGVIAITNVPPHALNTRPGWVPGVAGTVDYLTEVDLTSLVAQTDVRLRWRIGREANAGFVWFIDTINFYGGCADLVVGI